MGAVNQGWEKMNQTTNLVQWKNLSKEEQAEFDFGGYRHKVQGDIKWLLMVNDIPIGRNVYRLVIEPDKWYYCEGTTNEPEVLKGIDLAAFNQVEKVPVIRPVIEAEVSKPEFTPLHLEDKVRAEYPEYDAVMLEWDNDIFGFPFQWQKVIQEDNGYGAQLSEFGSIHKSHTVAQSMRGFYRYVYLIDGVLETSKLPIWPSSQVSTHPIGALFARGDK